jgi:hypothetical protein
MAPRRPSHGRVWWMRRSQQVAIHPWWDPSPFTRGRMRPRSRQRRVTLHHLSPLSRGKARSSLALTRHSRGRAGWPQNIVVRWH